jgi:PAS domain S-box-containing protein
VSAVAACLFLAIFVLRFAVADPESAILLLCVIPTALVAVEFGLRGGLAAAGLSCVLVVVWALVEAPALGLTGGAMRGIAFLVVGGMVGWIVDRRRSLEERNTRQFQLSLDMLGVAGFDGYFKWVNPAFERALGYSAEEFCSRPFLDMVHPEDRESTEAEAAKLAGAGVDTIAFQNRYRTKDGSYRWIEWTVRPLATEQLLYAVARDVTDRKLTEQYLAIHHEATRVLANSRSSAQAAPTLLRVIGEELGWAAGTLWTPATDDPGVVLRCTASWHGTSPVATGSGEETERLRLPPDAGLPGEMWVRGRERGVPDPAGEPDYLWVEPALADGLHARLLLPVPGNAGVLAVMEFLSHEVRPPDPALMRMLTTFAGQLGQFLERERVEAALAESQSQTRRILTTAHDAFVAMDRDGVITDWNPRARIAFGWTREEVLGRDLAETIIPKRFRERHRQGLERFLSGGGGPVLDRLIELAGLHRDGREFPVELTISAIESESGFSFYAFLRDVSERKLAEENLAGNLLEMRRLQLELEGQNEVLAERVRERTRELEEARFDELDRLALAAEYRDDDTQEHARRIGRTSGLLAGRLGLGSELRELLVRAAPLHDVGKIGIADSILLKPARLTGEEFEIVQTHAQLGAELLGGGRSQILQLACEIALTHHERWDGTGYPNGLAGDQIPIAGRIVSVADVFDALTHSRPYKDAWPVALAVREISEGSGRQFDPAVVAAFETLDHEALVMPIASPHPDIRSAAARTRAL